MQRKLVGFLTYKLPVEAELSERKDRTILHDTGLERTDGGAQGETWHQIRTFSDVDLKQQLQCNVGNQRLPTTISVPV